MGPEYIRSSYILLQVISVVGVLFLAWIGRGFIQSNTDETQDLKALKTCVSVASEILEELRDLESEFVLIDSPRSEAKVRGRAIRAMLNSEEAEVPSYTSPTLRSLRIAIDNRVLGLDGKINSCVEQYKSKSKR